MFSSAEQNKLGLNWSLNVEMKVIKQLYLLIFLSGLHCFILPINLIYSEA